MATIKVLDGQAHALRFCNGCGAEAVDLSIVFDAIGEEHGNEFAMVVCNACAAVLRDQLVARS